MGARIGRIWTTVARGGAGGMPARAERASAAPMPATRVALDKRTEGWSVNTVLIPRSFNCASPYARARIAAVIALTAPHRPCPYLRPGAAVAKVAKRGRKPVNEYSS